MGGLGNLKKDGACLQVSDLEAHKVNVINVFLGFTEVSCSDDRQKTADRNSEEISTPVVHKGLHIKQDFNN